MKFNSTEGKYTQLGTNNKNSSINVVFSWKLLGRRKILLDILVDDKVVSRYGHENKWYSNIC